MKIPVLIFILIIIVVFVVGAICGAWVIKQHPDGDTIDRRRGY